MPENNEAAKCLKRVRKYLFGNGIDVGCGTFPVVPNAIGIDVRPHAASLVGDVRSLDWFADDSLEFVFSSHCLEDLEDTHAVLTEWCRVIKPGGYLVLYLPHKKYYPNIGHPLGNKDHKHDFETWDVVSILQSEDFQHRMAVVETSVHGFGEGSYEDLHARGGHFAAEYSFQVVARKRGVEPVWAQSRLWVPPEYRAAARWKDGSFRVALIVDAYAPDAVDAASKTLLAEIGRSVGATDVVVVRRADINALHDSSSKAIVSTAWLVVDTTGDACAEKWAAAYDVDYVSCRGYSSVDRWGHGPRSVFCSGMDAARDAAIKAAIARLEAPRGGVSLCMIAKNEQQDLPHCLDSVAGLADEIILVDTGSTDNTPDLAASRGALVYFWPWADDFAAARNFSLERGRRKWLFWMDADDVLRTPAGEVKSMLESSEHETMSAIVKYGGAQFTHQRFFLRDKNVRFGSTGLVHEYAVIDGMRSAASSVVFEHGVRPAPPTKQRESRNLRLTRRQVETWPDVPRHWFYHGNALRESGMHEDAIAAYKKYIEIGWWRDELALAWRHLGESYASLGKQADARKSFLMGINVDARWAELYFHLATLEYMRGNVDEAIRWYEMAAMIPANDSALFKEDRFYGIEPLRALIKCHLRKDSLDGARSAAERLEKLTGRTTETSHVMSIVQGVEGKIPCPICKSRPKAAVTAIGFGWTKCAKCGLIMSLDQEPITSSSAIAPSKVVDSLSWESATRWVAGVVEEKARGLLQQPKMRVLDVMSAAPVVADEMQRRGHVAVSVDACQSAAILDMSKGLDVRTCAWEHMDASELGEPFDLVVLLNAIQHMTDPVDGLRKVAACLRPGGVVFTRHPDHDVGGVEFRVLRGETHWVLSNRSLEALADEAGLHVLSREIRNGSGEVDAWLIKPSNQKKYRPLSTVPDKPVLLSRNGAIGDVLMSTYAIKKVAQAYPGVRLHYAAHPSCQSMVVNNPHLELVLATTDAMKLVQDGFYSDVRYFEYPTLMPKRTDCAPHRRFDYPELPLPYHLVDLFAECAGVDERFSGGFGALELFLTEEEISKAAEAIGRISGYVTAQVTTGWSRYKEWPVQRWREVVAELLRLGIPVVQLGAKEDEWLCSDVPGFIDLRGKVGIRVACAVLSGARLHLGVDSIMNHVTNAVGVPGIILWGSTSPIGSGYEHNTNIVVPPAHGCQPCYRENPEMPSVHPKPPCPFGHVCMQAIEVDSVVEAIKLRLSV